MQQEPASLLSEQYNLSEFHKKFIKSLDLSYSIEFQFAVCPVDNVLKSSKKDGLPILLCFYILNNSIKLRSLKCQNCFIM